MGVAYNANGGAYWVPDAPAKPALQPTQPTPSVNTSSGGAMQSLQNATSGPGLNDVWVANPDGSGPMIRQDAYEGERLQENAGQVDAQRMQLQSKLMAEAEQRRLGLIPSLMNRVNAQPTISRGGPAADEGAARAAAFARAKEQAGSTALASLRSLQGVLENSGRMGGSLEASMTADVIGGAGNQVNEFTRDQLMLDLDRAADISDANYAGAITQRGQNAAMLPSLASLISASGGLY
jgi:hypothetical protein